MNAIRGVWTLPLAPIAVTIAYIVSVGLDSGIHAQTLARPLMIGIGVAIAITLVALAVTRRRDTAGAIALGLVVLVLSGGAGGTVISRTAWWQAAILIALVLLALVLFARIARRRWGEGHALLPTSTANVLAGLLLGVVLAGGTIDGRVGYLLADLSLAPETAVGAQQEAGEDIVVLILDGPIRVPIPSNACLATTAGRSWRPWASADSSSPIQPGPTMRGQS